MTSRVSSLVRHLESARRLFDELLSGPGLIHHADMLILSLVVIMQTFFWVSVVGFLERVADELHGLVLFSLAMTSAVWFLP